MPNLSVSVVSYWKHAKDGNTTIKLLFEIWENVGSVSLKLWYKVKKNASHTRTSRSRMGRAGQMSGMCRLSWLSCVSGPGLSTCCRSRRWWHCTSIKSTLLQKKQTIKYNYGQCQKCNKVEQLSRSTLLCNKVKRESCSTLSCAWRLTLANTMAVFATGRFSRLH